MVLESTSTTITKSLSVVRLLARMDNHRGGTRCLCRTRTKQTTTTITCRPREFAEEQRREFEQCGWVWRGEGPIERRLCHPDNPEIYTCFDPYTGEMLLSRKMAEELTRIQHEKLPTWPRLSIEFWHRFSEPD